MSEEAYKRLQSEVNQTKALLFSERDKVIDFEVEYPDKTTKTVHFKRLRATEWDDVVGAINRVGITDFSKATKEQLDQLNLAYCLALGYGSADGLNAEDWKQLDDKLLIETCFFKLMDITGVSKTALENLSWFRRFGGGQNEMVGVPKNG